MAAANVGQALGARTLTAWKQTQAEQATRRALTRRFLDNIAIASASFSNAHLRQVGGMVRLTAIAALDHLDAASASRLTLTNLTNAAQQDLDPVDGAGAVGAMLDVRI